MDTHNIPGPVTLRDQLFLYFVFFPRRSTAHTQLAFMPRALHRTAGGSNEKPSTSTPSNNSNEDATATGTPKSNADFRKMFLKQ